MTLKDLPVIVTEPGLYLTRNGSFVDVTGPCRDTVSTFKVEGYLLTKGKNGKVKRTWNIWHESGRYTAVGEHPLDIISKDG
jgi:hypothetical protein